MPLKALAASVPYFGGKKKLLGQLFRHVPPTGEALTFVDPFVGGGSVVLMAKLKGHRVLGNDLAARSAIFGRAVIANDRVRLTEDDLRRCFVEHSGIDGFVERHYVPDFFIARHARLIDNILAWARESHDPVKGDLLRLLAIHAILRWRPMGDFHQPGLIQKLVDGEIDGLNPKVYSVKIAGLFSHTSLERLQMIARDLNAAIFPNGMANEMRQGDAAEFLGKVEGDILYLDPPYFGSNSYEKVYAVLDSILAGKVIEPEPSRFNTRDAGSALTEMFERAVKFPLWLLSFGGGKLSAERCCELIGRFRPAEIVPVRHTYHFGSAGGRSANSKEILIVARRT